MRGGGGVGELRLRGRGREDGRVGSGKGGIGEGGKLGGPDGREGDELGGRGEGLGRRDSAGGSGYETDGCLELRIVECGEGLRRGHDWKN